MKIDLAIVARDLKLPPEKIEKTVELLDAGNTIPFITRFRKDLTGGLNEQQILAIKQRVAQLRALAERKSFVLKSIESQGKLTDDLATQINKSTTSRRLEDLYLPFKPKKQSRASLARQQGLEPLAEDIFNATSPDVEIATRATEFVRVDKGLTSVDDVIKGVADLLAERFSENDELRSTLRRIMWTDGKLTSQSVVVPQDVAEQKPPAISATTSPTPKTDSPQAETPQAETPQAETPQAETPQAETPQAETPQAETPQAETPQAETPQAETPKAETPQAETPQAETKLAEPPIVETKQAMLAKASEDPTTPALKAIPSESNVDVATDSSEPSTDNPSIGQSTPVESSSSEPSSGEISPAPVAETVGESTTESTTDHAVTKPPAEPANAPLVNPAAVQDSISPKNASDESVSSENKPPETLATSVPTKSLQTAVTSPDISATQTDSPTAISAVEQSKLKKKKKKKKKKASEDPFKDFQDFKQPIKQIPNHRVLAINRGERAGSLKVKIAVDGDKLSEASTAALVPEEHPFREFLQKCASDALNRMVVPSLEREIRRELTEAAEKHAVEVFANNLRNLLLQPPIRNRTVLAIDPGFKRGCSVAVLDPLGNVLDSGHVFVVGNQTRRDESKQKISNWAKKHKADVIAIGNGAACRQTEQMVSDTIAEHLQDLQTSYVMVNEAGASIYSTSEIGRAELPDVSPSIRSAISIGRRLQDPLSELVKISPANIGVGMYQHDVKAKHLSESLDEVVRFCVNQVGVDVNIASPSLLKFVSGLNALTARRVVEHRQANGQFKNRNQLKEISGFGEATFVQSAGFLRIHGGDMPLDCTSIHPESYNIANDVLKRIEVSVEEFFPVEPAPAPKIEVPNPVPTSVVPTSVVPTSVVPTSVVPTSVVPTSATSEAAATSTESTSDVAPVSEDQVTAEPGVSESSTTVASVSSDTEIPISEQGLEHEAPEDDSANRTSTAPTPAAPIPASETTTTEEGVTAPESETVSTPASQATAAAPAMSDDRIQKSLKRKEILRKIGDLDVDELAKQHSAGKLLVKDILMALKRPKWDPRDKISKPIFRRGIIKADDLTPNMQLDGQVVNVVDFGVFVDIGLGESSLVHVSQLSNHFIRDPHRFYSVGDVLKVWVSEIDTERRRVKLTAVRPGSKKPPSRRTRSSSGTDSNSVSRPSSGSSDSRGKSPTAHKPGKYGNKYGGGPQGKPAQRSSSGKGKPPYKSHVRRSKPKEVKPITDSMLKGDEPMRSFSDLAQFVSKNPKDSNKDKTDTEASF